MIYRTAKGITMPALGLGTFELTGAEGVASIRSAIEYGYRHIDTAIRYGNEAEVGQAIRESGIPRDEIFVTTKIWFDSLAPETVHKRIGESLERLQMDQVDLLLVHWPGTEVPMGETLAAFAEVRAAGQTRSIGVSNFTTALLDEAINVHGTEPVTNQIEYHPLLAQPKLLSALRNAGMILTAYLPLARGAVFKEEVIQEIGRRHGKSAAQVSLRWLLQQDGVAAIPRSSKIENIRSNFDIFDFELDEAEMAQIAGLDRQERMVDFDWSPEWDTI
ncbi:MAG: 2,5-didehydrogluconate reductase [Ahrensia sp.]|nr:2,5-didehydrogluconate reductase [Ahrensia sp.]|tara:strand:+ start:54783 stop:55607 length:825 start_codon:yes stop_codon:yes gene_type:complete